MKVLIKKDIIEEAVDEKAKLELLFLIHLIILKDYCDFYIDDPATLDTDFVINLQENDKRMFEMALQQFITANPTCHCEISILGQLEDNDKIFTRSEAIKYLLQPLSILVENSANDSHFLRALFRNFDSNEILEKAYQNNWLQFENAGGCSNVCNFIKAQVEHFNGKTKFLRYWVMLDGDQRYLNENVKKYDKLKKTLKDWNVSFHILNKRCMENYLPNKVFESKKNEKNKSWINAYLALSEEQKDFFNISGGFIKELTEVDRTIVKKKEQKKSPKDKKAKKISYVRDLLKQEEKTFYKDVSAAHFKALECGFTIPKKVFKDEFPLYFNDPIVTKNTLNIRVEHQANRDELTNIVNEILNLL